MVNENAAPQQNGKFIDTIDPDDPDYQKALQRPADVKEDIKQMENRKRVEEVMKSQSFKEELEQMVHDQISADPHPASLLAMQQMQQMFLPQFRFNQSNQGFNRPMGATIPIADIRGLDSFNFTKSEKIVRCKLASAYRLVEMHGWTTGINTHITARISQEQEHFLINPYGMLYHEVTASSLVKVDMQGEIVDAGSTALGINRAGYSLHSAIHAARPDVRTVMHIYCPAAIAVSSLQQGLLPLSREAIILGGVSRFEYSGRIKDAAESDQLARALGPTNKVLILAGNGIVLCAETVEEAYFLASNTMTACDAQLKAMPFGLDNLKMPSEEVQRRTYELGLQPAGQIKQGAEGDASKKRWRRGDLEFEAMMRHLDNAGYRTGYVYHEPLVRRELKGQRANSEVELPPTTSSMAGFWSEDEEELANQLLKAHLLQQKKLKGERREWLGTPNNYNKVQFDEIGTPNPKKITKWVAEDGISPNRTQPTAILLDKPNMFAPQGDNPRELKNKHKEIRKEYYEEKITAGPQSRILDGMTWEEAELIKESQGHGKEGMIVVGAASKGIIQREHQHNHNVQYKQYYAPNPFESMNEDDIEKYKDEVQNQGLSGGETSDDVTSPTKEGQLVSTEERMTAVRETQETKTNVDGATVDESTTDFDDDDAVKDDDDDKEPESPSSPKTPPPSDFQRTQSARFPHGQQVAQELTDNFNRSKSERHKKSKSMPVQREDEPQSPTSDQGDSAAHSSPEKKKKKKKGFRMPSFSKKEKEKK